MSKGFEVKLERNLTMYALAAAATLAAAHPAQAEVVFTPSNLEYNGFFQRIDIDIDNDGKTDFAMTSSTIGCTSSTGRGSTCAILWQVNRDSNAPLRNRVLMAPGAFTTPALVRGNTIGRPQDHFGVRPMVLETKGSYGGDWVNVTNRYLGIQFIGIDGQVHYGWIGFSRTEVVPHQGFQARFIGWAYETEPHTSIRAGQRTGDCRFPDGGGSRQVDILKTARCRTRRAS